MPQAVTPPAGLYIHVPFCHAKCFYCDFYSMKAGAADIMERYVEMARAEIDARVGEAPSTIYIGGGTPSALGTRLLDRLLSGIDTSSSIETTIEVNPEDVNYEFCRWLRSSPVGRVSMGIQSLNDDELRGVGRRHTASQAIEAVDMLRTAGGVENLSLDLIYGLPGSTLQSWQRSLDGVLDLEPEHLSAYLLSYEPRTRLSVMLQAGKVSETAPEDAERMYLTLCERSAQRGYGHYEISNFARPGYRAAHNSSYWDSTPYLGIGPGAHSFDGNNCRKAHLTELKRYISRGWESTLTVEIESESERFNDYLLTRLRTTGGIEMADCRERFGNDRSQRLMADAQKALSTGVLAAESSRLYIPERHMLVADSIIVQLIQD